MTKAALSHCVCSSQSSQGLLSKPDSSPTCACAMVAKRETTMKPMTGIQEKSSVSLMIQERHARPREWRRMTHVFFSAGWRSPS